MYLGTPTQPRPATGFTIVELLVAMALSLVIAVITTSFAGNVFKSNTQSIYMVQLSQEMRSAIQLISRDIRRSGYSDDALARYLSSQAINSGVILGELDANGVAGCLQVSYKNLTGGSVNAVYRLRTISGVGRVAAHFGATASCTTEIMDSGWADITDPFLADVSALEFQRSASQTDIAENPDTGNVIQVGIEAISIRISASLHSDDTVNRTITNRMQLRNQYLTI
jgi:prepilin-type N-terminal cleavage/methylation domain-containing protein